MKTILVKGIIFLFFSLLAVPAYAAPSFGFDFTFFGNKSGVDIKTHTTLFFEVNSGIEVGAVFQYENGYDIIAGGGLRIGKDFFLEVDGGYFTRSGGANGFGVIVQPGKNFSLGGSYAFRVSVPVVFKSFGGGSEVEYSPYIGFLFKF